MRQGYHRGRDAPNPLPLLSWDELPALFPSLSEGGRWLPLLRRHAAMIEAAAATVRITSVPAELIVRRHFAESLEILRIAGGEQVATPLVDVGSGGGFPGLVIAAVLPALEVHLVEPLQRRAALLREILAGLELKNVLVHAVRAEEAGRRDLRDVAGTVTARAVAPLRELLEYTAPLCRPGGLIALPKGSRMEGEIAEAATALAELACRLEGVIPMRPDVAAGLWVVLVRKEGPTPARYPRRAGVPRKRPL